MSEASLKAGSEGLSEKRAKIPSVFSLRPEKMKTPNNFNWPEPTKRNVPGRGGHLFVARPRNFVVFALDFRRLFGKLGLANIKRIRPGCQIVQPGCTPIEETKSRAGGSADKVSTRDTQRCKRPRHRRANSLGGCADFSVVRGREW